MDNVKIVDLKAVPPHKSRGGKNVALLEQLPFNQALCFTFQDKLKAREKGNIFLVCVRANHALDYTVKTRIVPNSDGKEFSLYIWKVKRDASK